VSNRSSSAEILVNDYDQAIDFPLLFGNDCHSFADFPEDAGVICEKKTRVEICEDDSEDCVVGSFSESTSCYCHLPEEEIDAPDFIDGDIPIVLLGRVPVPPIPEHLIEGINLGGMMLGKAVPSDPLKFKFHVIKEFIQNGRVEFDLPSNLHSCFDFFNFPKGSPIDCLLYRVAGEDLKECECHATNVPSMQHKSETENYLEKQEISLGLKLAPPVVAPITFGGIDVGGVLMTAVEIKDWCKKLVKRPCKTMGACTFAPEQEIIDFCEQECADLMDRGYGLGFRCTNLSVRNDDGTNADVCLADDETACTQVKVPEDWIPEVIVDGQPMLGLALPGI
jgi:hypothetical protein